MILSLVIGARRSYPHLVPAAGSWPRPHREAPTAAPDDTPIRTLKGFQQRLSDGWEGPKTGQILVLIKLYLCSD